MKRLFWVNCFPPSFHNVGDHAMTLAIQKFLSDNFNAYRITRFYRPEIERFLKEKLLLDDLIFIHSSGDFGDLYVNGPKLRKRVISAFPDNRIVQLPVSVHYENPASFEADKRFFSDFTFYLKPRRNRSKREGVLFVLRSDRESNFKGVFLRLTEKLTTPFRIFQRIFRKDILFVSTKLSRSADMRLLAWRIKAIFNDATVCDPQIADVDLTDENRESYIFSVLDFYGKFRVVVTDRFHGLVFARLARTKAIGIPSRIEKKTIIENEDYTPYFRDFRKLVFDYPRKKQIGRS
jgi:pyruvyl transferase EpsI